MILFPAIDLKDGTCVRLFQGDMATATVFSDDPVRQSRAFSVAGFEWLHVVDLNGAIEGRAVNGNVVGEIVTASKMRIQLGGGIRDLDSVETWLEAGIERVILGTAALHDPALVKHACRVFPGRIAVGIDGRAGKVAVQGWVEQSDISALELGRRFEDVGVAAIIYTDINRDGAMTGLNTAATEAFAKGVSTPVIASGGVASLDDLRAVRELEPDGVIGVISGRALYDGRLDIDAALELMST